MEIRADVLLKGTKVDGIFTSDPLTDPTATRLDRISHRQVIEQGTQGDGRDRDLAVQWTTACPIVVFNLRTSGNIRRAVLGEPVGSLVTASLPGGRSEVATT